MAKSIVVWNPETGEKKRLFTVDVKEMLQHESAWEIWSEGAEIRAAKALAEKKVEVEPTPAEHGSEEGSAGFPDNLDPKDLEDGAEAPASPDPLA